ncbi:MAG TPA: TlpA disulfide reductase family protein [Chitinophagaceae bacterium]|nr:TlpA disulfide reductase family protein [Chitinophagaceae bacterium]
MTPTIIFWLKIAVYLFIGYSVYTLVRDAIRRKSVFPKGRKEWSSIASDVLFLVLSVFLLNVIHKNYETPMEAVLQYKGKALPEFSYMDLKTNTEKTLAVNKNKVIILNIWATWCPPCRKEMPELDSIQKEFYDNGVTVVAISDEDPVVVSKFTANKNFSFEMGTFLHTNELINSINTRPVSILLVDGMVKDIVVGARGYSFFQDWATMAGSR